MRKGLVLFILGAAALSACGRAGTRQPVLPRNALPVPIIRQSSGHTCGAAALLAVLYYWQVYEGNESGLLGATGTAVDGTTPQGIVKGAREYGLAAYYKEMVTIDALQAALSGGETVILDIQAWPDKPEEMPWAKRREDGHYVVLTALDKEYAYFMDPSVGTGYTYIKLPELMERWHDYENLKGGVWNNERLAVFVRGKTPMKEYPAALTPTQ